MAVLFHLLSVFVLAACSIFNDSYFVSEVQLGILECPILTEHPRCEEGTTPVYVCHVLTSCTGYLSSKSFSSEIAQEFGDKDKSSKFSGAGGYSLCLENGEHQYFTTEDRTNENEPDLGDMKDYCGMYIFVGQELVIVKSVDFTGGSGFFTIATETWTKVSLEFSIEEGVSYSIAGGWGPNQIDLKVEQTGSSSIGDLWFPDPYTFSYVIEVYETGTEGHNYTYTLPSSSLVVKRDDTVIETFSNFNNHFSFVVNMNGTIDECTLLTVSVESASDVTRLLKTSLNLPLGQSVIETKSSMIQSETMYRMLCFDTEYGFTVDTQTTTASNYAMTVSLLANDEVLLEDEALFVYSSGSSLTDSLVYRVNRSSSGVTLSAQECANVLLILTPDLYPEELSYELLLMDSDTSLYLGSQEEFTRVFNLCEGGVYSLRVSDIYGDGLCCSYSSGDILIDSVYDAGRSSQFLLSSDSTYLVFESFFEIEFQIVNGFIEFANTSVGYKSEFVYRSDTSVSLSDYAYLLVPLVMLACVFLALLYPSMKLHRAFNGSIPDIREEFGNPGDKISIDDLPKDKVSGSAGSQICNKEVPGSIPQSYCDRLIKNRITVRTIRTVIFSEKFVNWISDVILLVTVISMFSSAPTYSIEVPKVTSDSELFVTYSEIVGSESLECTFKLPMDYSNDCSGGSIVSAFTASDYWVSSTEELLCPESDDQPTNSPPEEKSEDPIEPSDDTPGDEPEDPPEDPPEDLPIFVGPGAFSLCTSGSITIDTNDGYGICDHESSFDSGNFESVFEGTCTASGTSLDNMVEFTVGENTWDCTQSSSGSWECLLNDYVVINLFMLLFFVMTAKEVIILAYSQFCISKLSILELEDYCPESAALFAIACYRLGHRHYTKKDNASSVLSENRFFFFIWMVFEAIVELASVALTTSLLLTSYGSTWGSEDYLNLLAFVTSFFAMIISSVSWRKHLSIIANDVVKRRLLAHDQLSSKRTVITRSGNLGIYQLPKDVIYRQEMSWWHRLHGPLALAYLATRLVATFVIMGVTARLSYTDYGENRININFKLKSFFLIYFVTFLGELAIFYDRYEHAKISIVDNVYSVFTVRFGLITAALMDTQRYNLIRVIGKSISNDIHSSIARLPRYSFFRDIVIYASELVGLVLLLELVSEFRTQYEYARDGSEETADDILDYSESLLSLINACYTLIVICLSLVSTALAYNMFMYIKSNVSIFLNRRDIGAHTPIVIARRIRNAFDEVLKSSPGWRVERLRKRSIAGVRDLFQVEQYELEFAAATTTIEFRDDEELDLDEPIVLGNQCD